MLVLAGSASAQTKGCEADVIEVRLEADGGSVSVFRMPRHLVVTLITDNPDYRDPRRRCDLFSFSGRSVGLIPGMWTRFGPQVPGADAINTLSIGAYNGDDPASVKRLQINQSLADRILEERAYVKEGDWYVSSKYNTAFLDPMKEQLLHGIWLIWASSLVTAPISNSLYVSYGYRVAGIVGEGVRPRDIKQSLAVAESIVLLYKVQ